MGERPGQLPIANGRSQNSGGSRHVAEWLLPSLVTSPNIAHPLQPAVGQSPRSALATAGCPMRLLWLFVFPVAGVVLSVAPASLPGQATTYAVAVGTVADPDGAPIPDATILSHNLSNGERWQTTTDAR